MALLTDISSLEGGRLLPIVEDFYTIQGEGYHTGRATYFIRLGGCDVGCSWCDAKYSWNPQRFPATPVGEVVARVKASATRAVVITGGEPLLYPLGPLTEALHREGYEIYIETSGSHPFSGELDWVCLSPKRKKHPLEEAYGHADELKVVIEKEEDFEWAEENARKVGADCRLYLQPEWSVAEQMMPLIVDYVKAHPRWEVSIQTHKYMQIP